MLNGLDLFSGIGGLSLALAPWVQPIAYCENDRYAQAVLLSRMFDGFISQAPIWDDVRELSIGVVTRADIIYGGFPCQDISVAGHGIGLEGKRSGLVFELLRLCKEIRPTFIFLENVPAIRTRGAEQVGKTLAAMGYDCRWDVISASEVGAPHLRKRWFLLAYSVSDELRNESWRRSGKKGKSSLESCYFGKESWRETGPDICGVDDGLPFRVDALRGLGNAVVPLQAREAFKRLMGI